MWTCTGTGLHESAHQAGQALRRWPPTRVGRNSILLSFSGGSRTRVTQVLRRQKQAGKSPRSPPSCTIGRMTEATRILELMDQGDPSAAHQLLPLVYGELRKLAAERMAQEKPGQTLQAT